MKPVFVFPLLFGAAMLCDFAYAQRPGSPSRPAPVHRGAERGTLVHGEGVSSRDLTHDLKMLRHYAQRRADKNCESGSAIRESKWDEAQDSGVSDGKTECERDSSDRIRCTHSAPEPWVVTKVGAWFRCE